MGCSLDNVILKTWLGFYLLAHDRRYGFEYGESDKAPLVELLKETTPELVVRLDCGS